MTSRRDFITLLAGAAAWPIAARAQQPAVPVVGYLSGGTPDAGARLIAAFRKALDEAGFVEGRSVTLEYRFANDEIGRLPELAADLVRRRVGVILASGVDAARAAQAATRTIPIVFRAGSDPIEANLVASLNRPGGNVTGINDMGAVLGAKRLGLLHDMLPRATRFAVLVDPNSTVADPYIEDARAAAAAIGLQIEVFDAELAQIYLRPFGPSAQAVGVDPVTAPVRDDAAIEAAINSLGPEKGGLVVLTDGFLSAHRATIIVTANRNKVPTISSDVAFARNGGLLNYFANYADMFRGAAGYVDRILRGEKPADLPVQLPTRYDLSISLKTAKAIGLTVPNTLLVSATEVIE